MFNFRLDGATTSSDRSSVGVSVSSEPRARLEKRDGKRCRYCLASEDNRGLRMRVDHIAPESAGGPSTADNPCLACFSRNVSKGAKRTGNDPRRGTFPKFQTLDPRSPCEGASASFFNDWRGDFSPARTDGEGLSAGRP